MSTILDLNAYHAASAACLIRDGALIAAAEEERFRRIKHRVGLPTEAVRFRLAEAGVSLGDLDHITASRHNRPNSGGNASDDLAREIEHGASVALSHVETCATLSKTSSSAPGAATGASDSPIGDPHVEFPRFGRIPAQSAARATVNGVWGALL